MSGAESRSPRKRGLTMTELMLSWAIDHHIETGESEFDLDRVFQRAAAQHYHGTWWSNGYYVKLRPPRIHNTGGAYRVTVEVDSDV